MELAEFLWLFLDNGSGTYIIIVDTDILTVDGAEVEAIEYSSNKSGELSKVLKYILDSLD